MLLFCGCMLASCWKEPSDVFILATDSEGAASVQSGNKLLIRIQAVSDNYKVDRIRISSLDAEQGQQQLMDTLKGCSILNSKLKLIRMSVGQDELTITNNSESADYEARIPCQTTGDVLNIAFAEKYLIDTIGAIRADKTIMKFNTPVSPVYITVQGSDGVHMCLPVRLQEAKQDE